MKMKSIPNIFFLLVFSFILTSCGDRYEIKEDKHGRTIRLDKRSGEIVVIQGSEMLVVKSPEQVEQEKEAEKRKYEALSKPIRREVLTIPSADIDSVYLTTKWSDDMMIFRLTIKPIPEQYTKYVGLSDPYTVYFIDSTGFRIASENISKSDFHNLVDENGIRTSIQVEERTPCIARDYLSIESWSLSWRTGQK